MFDRPLEELDAGEVLDAFEGWHAEQVDREVRKFVAAAHFADLHHPDRRATPEDMLPGCEQPRRLGGPGTPVVMEFATADLGARMGKSPYAGRMLMADALDVRHRLPRLWTGVRAGEVPVGYARFVAQQTRELSEQAAGAVDAEVADYADGRVTWSRFETLVAAKVIAADPDLAAAKEQAAAAERFAKVGRSNDHGQKTLYVKSGAAEIIRVGATIDFLAAGLKTLGDDDTEDRRRAKAVLIMANPVQAIALLQAMAAHRATTTPTDADESGADEAAQPPLPADDENSTANGAEDSAEERAGAPAEPFLARFRPDQASSFGAFGFDPATLLPPVTIYLHLSEEALGSRAGGVVRWEGEGPISTHYVRDFLGPRCRFTVKPVLDPASMAPVDGYEVPDRMREAVQLRSPADVFPYATSTGRRHEMDHTKPYLHPDHGGPPGQTGLHNLGPLTRFHHRIKTFGAWQVKQPFPGIFVWRDPHGRLYLVDHTGTRTLGKSPRAPDPAPDAGPHVTVEVYPGPFPVEIDYRPDRHVA